jgi:dipeptidyl aminopeptidase/acylaminoacyl peptidase
MLALALAALIRAAIAPADSGDGAAAPAAPAGIPLPAGLADPSMSPDGRYAVAWEVVAAQQHPVHIVESTPGDQLQPKLRTFEYLKPGDRIEERMPRLFRADGTEVAIDRESFSTPWSNDQLRWAADGKSFTFLHNRRGHQLLRLVSVDAASGAVRTVVEEQSPTFVDYAHKTWMHWLSETELLWMSERDGWNHLYLVDVAAGRISRRVTTGAWVVRAVESVDDDARTVTIRAMGIGAGQDPYHEHWLRIPIDGGDAVRLTRGDGTHRIEWSPGGRWYVDTWSRVDLPPVRELRDGTDGSLVCELGPAEGAPPLPDGWTAPERFVAKGRDGVTDIHGVIWRPRGTAGDPTPRPVVECVYAGPQGYFAPKEFGRDRGQRAMADAGFIVVQADGMGTNWRGKAFHDVCWKNLKDAGFADRIAWIRAAAATRPWMDLSRIGIYGGSAGGQSAMRALIDHHDFYRVAVADCGCHDNRMDKIWWNELWMGWPVDESYARSSNVVDAARLQGRLMLVVGELDQNVDPASTMQASAALVRAGIEHELVVVPGAGHGAAETPYGSRKRLEFLRRHLQEPR